MLLKPFQRVFIPSVPARAEQLADLWCNTQGGGNSSGSTPTPGQRCTTVAIYGPASSGSGGGPSESGAGGYTIVGYKTVCT